MEELNTNNTQPVKNTNFGFWSFGLCMFNLATFLLVLLMQFRSELIESILFVLIQTVVPVFFLLTIIFGIFSRKETGLRKKLGIAGIVITILVPVSFILLIFLGVVHLNILNDIG